MMREESSSRECDRQTAWVMGDGGSGAKAVASQP